MDFSFTQDHIALRDAVRVFCDGTYPAPERGNAQTETQAQQRWRQLAELGLFGLDVPAEYGGSGLGAIEIMLAAQQLGRVLGGGGWIASHLPATWLLVTQGQAAQRDAWLPGIVAGTRRVALAHAEADARYALTKISARASRQGDGWRLGGKKTYVADAPFADAFIVAARTSGAMANENGISLFLVPRDTAGVSLQAFDTLDSRRAAHIGLDGVELGTAALIGRVDQGFAPLQAALDRTTAALSAEAVGAIEALLEMTATYMNDRVQFGAPLAKFQVLQHRVADMLIWLEQCESLAVAAAVAVDEDDVPQRRRVVSAAKALTGQVGRLTGQWAIQIHGGMGMTDECRVGHYAKRLLVINQWLGDAAHHLQQFVQQRETT
jgi:pimeloyl-CoA dehydrogenase